MPSINVELRVYIDLNGDGDFNDIYENVSGYVRQATWFLGWRERYQDVADTPTASITLDSSLREWSPEVAGAFFSIYPPIQKQVLIAARYFEPLIPGFTESAMWRGWIDKVAVVPGENVGDRSVTVYCTGHKKFIDSSMLVLPLQEAKRADQIIDAVFSATTQPISKSLEPGAVIYPYAGDTFDDFTTGYQAIRAVTEAERGRFWYDRNGAARFMNRTTIATDITTDVGNIEYATITYDYGQDVINDVRVNCYPRGISVTNDIVLWTRQGEITIPPGNTRTLRATFNDGTGAQVAGRNLQVPNVGAGTLAFSGGNVFVTGFTPDARGVEIALSNTGGIDATVTTLIVKGQKITALNVEQARAQDAASIALYGRRMLTLDLPLLYSADLAKDIADYELFRRSKPRGAVGSVKQVSNSREVDQSVLLATIMGRVTVSETQTGHAGTYWIIGEEHTWLSGRLWATSYILEPANTTAFWLLEIPSRSELDMTTILGL